MPAAIERLRFAARTLPGVLAGFSEGEGEQRPSLERWTKKEVVGHLIDSASNNHQRFVRGQLASGQDFPRYEQEEWVRIQGYLPDRRRGRSHPSGGVRRLRRSPGASPAQVAGPVGGRGGMRWELRRVADLVADEEAALHTLSLAVYPP
jgi:hypothetical protein